MLASLYALGHIGWVLGFVFLVPWLRALDGQASTARALLLAWAMAVAYLAAAFAWFGVAIGNYTQLGPVIGMAVLLLAAPLLQPQFLVFALVRHFVRRAHGRAWAALAAACAWVAAEWIVPRLLGDTLGYGLHPSRLLRQAADVGGTAGLTLLLLLANEGVAAAWARRRDGVRAIALPLAFAVALPLLLAAYGVAALASQPGASPMLRMGLVQSNIVDYERLRREKGAGAVVREVLDTHYAMTYDAVERQRADAVLWSETVYPTTFGRPKSEAGAELDREILEIVDAAGVPFVFGTYDRDAAGEYNAAAFVAPRTGIVGFYRKSRPFPLTEYVPGWLEGPALRRWLPWAGSWKPGTGARVFPLRLKDGREIPVLPMICLDDVDTALGIEGARMGGQVILAMSNDAWFPAQGARLHQAAAAFRSIETRLPQFRVTTNGYSAIIDATGDVVAGSRRGERTLVVGDVPVREPPRTLLVAWGDWVPRAAALFLALFAIAEVMRRWGARGRAGAAVAALPAQVVVLPVAARVVAGVLRSVARAGLLWLAAVAAFGDGSLQSNMLAQIRTFALLFLVPEAAAWFVLRAFAARAALAQDTLVLARGSQRLELPLRELAAIEPWTLPIPAPGASLRMASGARHEVVADPAALAAALGKAPGSKTRTTAYADARAGVARGRLDHPVAKFVLLPLLLAIPAFRLHQHISFGSSFGEIQAFGLFAYLRGFALWWASWAIAVALVATVLRAAIEAGTLAAVLLRPAAAGDVRRWLHRIALAGLYLGMPGWLLLRLLAS